MCVLWRLLYSVLESRCCLQVKSRVAVLNQRHPERTIWKESAICTKTWNSSVLQLIDVGPRVLALSPIPCDHST